MANLYVKAVGFLAKTIMQNGAVGSTSFSDLGKVSASDTRPPSHSSSISTAQTIDYQNREILKEMLLLEKHLQQGCSIDGIACDCCEKHPTTLEALAEETYGMTARPVYKEIKEWVSSISPKVSEAASQSGKFGDEYPLMAVRARELRKKLSEQCSTCSQIPERVVKLAQQVKNKEITIEEAKRRLNVD